MPLINEVERSVLLQIAQGVPRDVIAKKMDRSLTRVANITSRACSKLRVSTTPAAIAVAVHLGILTPAEIDSIIAPDLPNFQDLEMLILFSKGVDLWQIGAIFECSPNTVDRRLERIQEVFRAQSLTEACKRARSQGYFSA